MSNRFFVIILLMLVAGVSAATMDRVAVSDRPATEKSVAYRTKESAIALSAGMDRDLSERYIGIQQLARDVAAHNKWNWKKSDDANPLTVAINRYVARSGDALSMLVAPDGKLLAANTRNSQGDVIDTTPLYGENFVDALWFTAARDGNFLPGKNGLTGTAVTGPYNDKAVAALMGNDGLTLAFSTPMTDDSGKMLGVWVNFLSFSHIERMIADAYQTLSNDGLARTNITLLDSKGLVLVDFDPSVQGDYKRNYAVIGKLNLLDAGVEAATKAITEKQAGVSTAPFSKKALLVDGYSYSQGAGDYPGLGWTVLVRARSEELFAHLATAQKLRKVALILVGAAALLGALVAPLLTRTRKMTAVVTPEKSPAADMTSTETPKKKSSKRGALAETLAPEMQSVVQEVVAAATDIRREMEKLQPLVQETKRRASLINGTVSHAAMSATQMDGVMSELSAATEEISRALSRSQPDTMPLSTLTESMQALIDTTDHLHTLTPFITSLANQMNLLALNAAIEAARAGESGESLVTLANELKALAAEATTNTETITRQLTAARGIRTETIDALKAAANRIESTASQTREVSASLEQQRNAASKITRNAANTSSGIREITEIVGSVEQGADETAAAVKQMQATTATLQRHITILHEKVDAWIEQLRAA